MDPPPAAVPCDYAIVSGHGPDFKTAIGMLPGGNALET